MEAGNSRPFHRMKLAISRLDQRSQSGSTLVEAALVIALISAVCAMGLTDLRPGVKTPYCQSALALDGGTTGSGLPPPDGTTLDFACGDVLSEPLED